MAALNETRATWQSEREVGSELGIRLLVWTVRILGRRVAEAVLSLVAAYYVLAYGRVRRVSREYLRRVGVAPSLGNVYRHVRTFACCALHRFFFVANDTARFYLERVGMEALETLAQSGRGAILLGAHFGSFEALRAGARKSRARVNVVMDNRHAQRIRRFLDAVAPDDSMRILEVGEGGPDLVLRARECIERGELVAILADRAGGGQRTVSVPFLGDAVDLPSGPFLMAAQLRCPVFITLGIYDGAGRYELRCEPFAECLVHPRGERETALAESVGRYAACLERACREHPFNWFNFYDYWSSTESA